MKQQSVALDVDGALDPARRTAMLAFQLHVTEFMGVHLIDCCASFDGDLHEMLIFTIVAQRYLREQLAEQIGASPVERRAVSTARLAAETGMPRETVRRKLLSLEARGWIEKADRVGWRMAVVEGHTQARIDLEDLLKRKVRRTLKFARAIKPYL